VPQSLAGGARLANIPTARRPEMTCFARNEQVVGSIPTGGSGRYDNSNLSNVPVGLQGD
jgi:hypothetical protein